MKVVQAGSKIEEVPELIAVASDDKEDESDEEEPSKFEKNDHLKNYAFPFQQFQKIQPLVDRLGLPLMIMFILNGFYQYD